jgi:hypothetical protein
MIDDSYIVVIIGLLCFIVGFLARGELPKLSKKKAQQP